ncbi:MAG TPA: AMP-binding protein, partial [Solirubrobacteraceae bacterium]|nr:AMP-binding protein [Solirubrobacteraceae bacterium]
MQVEAWLQRAACSAPTLTALQTPEGRLSYAELLHAARSGAGALCERGARPGGRVAIALPPGLAFAQALHACLLLGAVAVPVDLRLTAAERERIVVGASVLLEEPLHPESLDPGYPLSPDADADLPAADALHELDDVCTVIHTSGTTSAPRPIELTYGNFLWSALGSAVALGVDPQERWLCALPLSHVGGLSILLRSAIYASTAVVHERFHTDSVLAALGEDRITLVSLVSTTLARLLDAGLSDPPRLRCALTGGGPVPAALVQRAREAGVPVIETYGLTECCSQAATAPLAAIATPEVGAGVPLFCTRTEIAATELGTRSGERQSGEIVLSGPTVARGAVAQDGRLHTGDLGWLDKHGFLHVSGRESDTIVSGGENVAPSEVEAVLEACPGVLEAAVVGRADPHWGEAVTAIVVAVPGASLGEERLREHCVARLAPFKVPKRVELSTAPLPRTRSGK